MRSLAEFLLSGHFTPSSYLVLNNPHGRAAESRTRIRQSLATCFVIGSSWSFLPTVPTIYLKTIELLLPIVPAGLGISGGIQAASRLEELTYFNHRDQTSGLATHLCESLIYRQISPSKISLFNILDLPGVSPCNAFWHHPVPVFQTITADPPYAPPET